MVGEAPDFWWNEQKVMRWLLLPVSWIYGFFARRRMERAILRLVEREKPRLLSVLRMRPKNLVLIRALFRVAMVAKYAVPISSTSNLTRPGKSVMNHCFLPDMHRLL